MKPITLIVKCVVACINFDGDSDFYFVKGKTTPRGFDNNHHKLVAKRSAKRSGYIPHLVFDENDCGYSVFKRNAFDWDNALIETE